MTLLTAFQYIAFIDSQSDVIVGTDVSIVLELSSRSIVLPDRFGDHVELTFRLFCVESAKEP